MKLIRIITKHLLLATVAMIMTACASEDFVGDERLHEANDTPPIHFNGGTEAITRATSNTGTTAQKLDGQFKIYGVKSGATPGADMQNVFVNYVVWYADNSANTTTSNSNNWEYVGNTSVTYGSANTSLSKEQTIKFWDYGAADYRFVAGSPVSAFTYNVTSTTEPTVTQTIATASVTGLAGHINAHPIIDESTKPLATNPVYVAKPKIITSTHYREPVTFEFVRQQAQVRVGIYETIPGYVISDIHFYTQVYNADTHESSWKTPRESGNSVVLASTTPGYFVGATNGAATIEYDWTASPPSYTYRYDTAGESPTVSTAQNWYGGVFKALGTQPAVKAITSTDAGLFGIYGETGADADMAANGYFSVLPTLPTTDAAPLLIKCDYTLKSIDVNSDETIDVEGATAAIPAAFTKWAPNTLYTYLFKISDNTNGSTGQNISGLYPITFAAVESDGGSMGTTTIVTTPSITTYQEGSVVDVEADGETPAYHGIKYVTGKTIYATVAAGGTGQLLPIKDPDQFSGAKVFYLGKIGTGVGDLDKEPTEADLQVTAPTGSDPAPTGSVQKTLGVDEVTIGTATLPASDEHGSYYLTFTPADAGYYAIQYQMSETEAVPAVYVYKIVHVEAAPGS